MRGCSQCVGTQYLADLGDDELVDDLDVHQNDAQNGGVGAVAERLAVHKHPRRVHDKHRLSHPRMHKYT